MERWKGDEEEEEEDEEEREVDVVGVVSLGGYA